MTHQTRTVTPQSVVWLVGASTGIGKALALRLAASGRHVAVTSRSAERLQALADQSSVPGAIKAFPGDVTDTRGLADVVARIESRMGPIQVAILNAGDYEPMALEDFDPDLFRRLIEVNYLGVVNGLAAVMPSMLSRAEGQILVTASLAGYRGLPRAAPYGASKAAVINMAESLQPELAMKGVQLRVINPGFVKTPMTDKNRFHMPFLMEPEAAVDAIMKGLEGKGFEISFPRPFALIMKTLRMMPHRLFLALTRRMVDSR
ncbi:SDR family NAD(P)-dependent oxidoreductase [Ectothiorhodospira lacustris]|uniref:SDR family NAD(P)-dependent oxidoreductase n=1 Tax=Ectothiorhodospira lacustris TaxID=2899127 RepID=UPI001EE79221|nr:SDR family NAD(P)-dependent oxidoreductase [Ectothiorhodospira lacustris]MCG5500010.1 SDR family NAD(P)-dependent oxidoreductase [Ectothiorhodospira lacustris]